MAKNWTSALVEHHKKKVKVRSHKVDLVQCHCGKRIRPNRDGIARCFDCKLHVNVNLFK